MRPTPCLRWVLATGFAAGRALAQEPDVPADTLIRLQRTSCLGPCPVYIVTIDGRGTVTYEGEWAVRVVGRRTSRIDPSMVAGLLLKAERIGFFELRDAYREIDNGDGTAISVTDLPSTLVTVTGNGRTKRVEDYVAAPDSLASFEREIDAAADTTRWILLDEHELDELTRSGWLASSVEGTSLLKEAIRRNDVRIAERLIELGAGLHGPPDHPFAPLLFARSRLMVDVLVRFGANPNERLVGAVAARTPLMATSYKDAEVAEALLKAGAHLEDVDEDRTALWWAACAGNWRVVTVLLRAGANPRGAPGMSAAECTRRARQDQLNRRRTVLERGQPTVEDFARVLVLLESAQKPVKR